MLPARTASFSSPSNQAIFHPGSDCQLLLSACEPFGMVKSLDEPYTEKSWRLFPHPVLAPMFFFLCGVNERPLKQVDSDPGSCAFSASYKG